MHFKAIFLVLVVIFVLVCIEESYGRSRGRSGGRSRSRGRSTSSRSSTRSKIFSSIKSSASKIGGKIKSSISRVGAKFSKPKNPTSITIGKSKNMSAMPFGGKAESSASKIGGKVSTSNKSKSVLPLSTIGTQNKKSGKFSKLKKAVAIGAVAYGAYKIGQLSNKFSNYEWGNSYKPKYSFDDWNKWRQDDGQLCRDDRDCWMAPNMACYPERFEREINESFTIFLLLFRGLITDD